MESPREGVFRVKLLQIPELCVNLSRVALTDETSRTASARWRVGRSWRPSGASPRCAAVSERDDDGSVAWAECDDDGSVVWAALVSDLCVRDGAEGKPERYRRPN